MSVTHVELVGEDLVVEYITYVDSLWAQNPSLVASEYFTHLGASVADDAGERAATIRDTDGVPPSQWVFRDAFIGYLAQRGQYSQETAMEFTEPPAA